jgi:trans-2,3-dihydro-3-hydroxyanthranilate isomerase
MPRPFLIFDVFTPTRFGGNQLAVLPEAEGLDAATMQAITREFNFAETVFILPPADPASVARVRIFTPGAEVPFAGHPTVGTAAALTALGRMPAGIPCRLEEGIGPVVIEAQPDGSAIRSQFTIVPKLESRGDAPACADVARVLSLAPERVLEVTFASVGLPFCLVRLEDEAAVDAATIDRAAWERHFAGRWSAELYCHAGGTTSGSEIHARMFAPAFGIIEDAATGSAAAALATQMAARHPDANLALSWRIHQGVIMGRPSLIEVSARKADSEVIAVTVGGHSVLVAEGELCE